MKGKPIMSSICFVEFYCIPGRKILNEAVNKSQGDKLTRHFFYAL